MCLRISRWHHPFLKPKVARKDIPCYKVLNLKLLNKEALKYTPYKNLDAWSIVTPCVEEIITKETIWSGLYVDERWGNRLFPSNNIDKDTVITVGAIHSYSYRTKLEALPPSLNYIRVMAYIPKGTKYYIGKDGDYASEMIKFY